MHELPGLFTGCGAAGSYVLKHPKIAKTLVDQLLNAAIATQAEPLITSNIGCALHLPAELRERGSPRGAAPAGVAGAAKP